MDRAIIELAERQHGKVARRQLLELGLGRKAIDYRLQAGDLRPDRRGVYSLGHHPQSRESRWTAAVLYAGEGAVLSFWSAAAHLGLRRGGGPLSHVTSPRRRRSPAGIRMHYAQLADDEITAKQGIPTTTPARTLLDLAPLLPSPTLARMIDAAPSVGAPLAELLERYPGRSRAPRLREALAKPGHLTRSDFEAHVLHLIDKAGLPRPEVNAVVEGYEVDLVWREYGVIAELDSYVTHGSPLAFERDRKRDRCLAPRWTVARLTDQDTGAGIEDLRRLLAATAARSPSHRVAAA